MRHRTEEKVLVGWVIFLVLANIAWMTALLWVAIHFIRKWW